MLATHIEAAILKGVIQPEAGNLAPEAAHALLALGFSESDHQHMAELSQKRSQEHSVRQKRKILTGMSM